MAKQLRDLEGNMKQVNAALGAAFALCASQLAFAQAPSQLRSAKHLEEDAGKGDSWTYRNPRASIAKYQRFIILPTDVYSSPTARWGSTSPAQRAKYAAYMTNALRTELGKSYEIVDRPGPGVASMRLTLLGVSTTTKVAATASRATPLGLAFHGVKSLAGKEGSFTGGVQAALEISDSRSGELLFAAVRRRSPDALDIEATLSTERTVQAVADDIAASVRKGLNKANGR
jgi:hypothetical protein